MKKILTVSIILNIIALLFIIHLYLSSFMKEIKLTLHSDDNAFIIKDLTVIQTDKYIYLSEPKKYMVNNNDIKNVYFSVIDSTNKELYSETHTVDYDTKKENNNLEASPGNILKYKKNIKFKIGYETSSDDYHYTTIDLN